MDVPLNLCSAPFSRTYSIAPYSHAFKQAGSPSQWSHLIALFVAESNAMPPYTHALMQFMHPMHSSLETNRIPFSFSCIASEGHASLHNGLSHWRHTMGTTIFLMSSFRIRIRDRAGLKVLK